ncbi:MAG: hypothetical protein M3Y88_06700 [Chloroflexota bacterium]|nr:hypothetical protein [Chloroflexota bacterium]
MAETDAALDAIRRAAEELLPPLTERLGRYGLGEIEVRRGDLRVRVAGRPVPPATDAAARATPRGKVQGNRGAAAGQSTAASGSATAQEAASPGSGSGAVPVGVASPAVGFFAYAAGLGPGLAVKKGEPLGWVEMLGVRHDVRAPRSGTVRNLVTESGEAVEYGQLLIELEAGSR